MNRLIKKGFTFIELMIVISIIGILSIVLIPKILPLKNQAKNNSVQANVFLVRSFLENRSSADKKKIAFLLTTQSITTTLNTIQVDIGSKLGISFSGSNTLKNPFNNTTAINYISPNLLNNNPTSSAIVIGYDVNSIPSVESSITNPIVTPGVIAIMVYQTGYVVYGIDNSGIIIQPTLVNIQNSVTPQLPNISNPPAPQVATPSFTSSINGGITTYSLSCDTPGVTIKYTINGGTLTTYSIPITVTTTSTINAYATYSGMYDSKVASVTYTPQVATPTFSYSFNGTTGGNYTITCTTPNAIIYYTTDGSLPDNLSSQYSGPINVTTNTIITAFAIFSGMTDSDIANVTYTSPSLNYSLGYKNSNFITVLYKPTLTCASVILHYKINSGSQTNVNMSYNTSSLNWENVNLNLSSKLKSNDVINYYFTYTSNGTSADSPLYNSTYNGK